MTAVVADRIEKQVRLKAPRARVWRALTDAGEFGTLFGVTLEGPFVEGSSVRGRITNPRYAHVTLEVLVERIEPERYFSYRWHPYAIDNSVDYSQEPMTLVEFRLEDASDGTLLRITESGFDRIPLSRRGEAFRMNDGGWTAQARNIEQYVAGAE
jgi:uncharacterized protein YndB with AHSA1/START domain